MAAKSFQPFDANGSANDAEASVVRSTQALVAPPTAAGAPRVFAEPSLSSPLLSFGRFEVLGRVAVGGMAETTSASSSAKCRFRRARPRW